MSATGFAKISFFWCFLLTLSTSFAESVDEYGGFCREGFDGKIANLELVLKNTEATIPNVPPTSQEYFEKEYWPSLHSGSENRFAMLERQPFYAEWEVRKALSSVIDGLNLVKKSDAADMVHPTKSISKNRIFWASNTMQGVNFLTRQLVRYTYKQRASQSPTISNDRLIWLDSAGDSLNMTLWQIVWCELQKMPDPPNDKSLKTVSGIFTSPSVPNPR